MSEKALVLSADTWNMVDEKTGEKMAGVSCWFVNPYRTELTEGQAGYKPAKVSCSHEVFLRLKSINLPAICDMVYGAKPGAAGKATLVLVGIENPVSVNIFAKKPA